MVIVGLAYWHAAKGNEKNKGTESGLIMVVIGLCLLIGGVIGFLSGKD